MIVSPLEPYKVIYSIFNHEYLGYLVEGYVAQLNAKGEVSYKTQNISYKNLGDFKEGISNEDIELIKLTDEIQQDFILKKFASKKLSQEEFFKKVFDLEKGDKILREAILAYIENRKNELFSKIKDKNIFVMGNDGIPTWKPITIIQEHAKAYFHFERLEDHTIYYPIIKCGEDKIKFQFKNAVIINDIPAAMLLDSKLYLFDQFADGKKIKPFLNKPNILIPKKIEDVYYQKFIVPLVARFNVFAKGFEIINEKEDVSVQLVLNENVSNKSSELSLFDSTEKKVNFDTNFNISLKFQYGQYSFNYDNFGSPSYVHLEKKEDNWTFHKLRKNLEFEKNIVMFIRQIGFDFKFGVVSKPKTEVLEWLMQNAETLKSRGIEIIQSNINLQQYFVGHANIDIKINENNDWFDVNAIIEFGEYKIPFKKLRNYIVQNIKEFLLPNGQIAIIPQAWFAKYSELFELTQSIDESETLKINVLHTGLIFNLDKDGVVNAQISRKLARLYNFSEIEDQALPTHFKGNLRPYQKAGYDWLYFLRSYNLGGCLADDMGLGKTITTLAFLLKIYETKSAEPSILIMPTSLIYNWQKEAQKFAPNLKILIHFGQNRYKSTEVFKMYDIIICSYGVLRLDIDMIKSFQFEYAILDESQAIKNPGSLIFKSVMQLNTKNRLILTGTPLENSTMDLWSQMTFVNPGILGSMHEFKQKYQNSIEKLKDVETTKKLFARIKPFMLRRHKSQVAKDLPPKIESIQYSQMTEEQEKLYEETKSYVRNMVMEASNKGSQSSILVLQGLTKLRQIANNPILVDENYEGSSGKEKDILHKLMEVVENGSKILVFSQFVKHLNLIAKKLNENQIPYLYLDGATKNRIELVEEFQHTDKKQVFLISLKAGGVGLNLTSADYVFLLDPWWNPAVEAQAIDRAHRIGQKNTVFSYKFISRNTIEEKILDLQSNKKRLFDELISAEEGFEKTLSQADILSLLD